jgi:hypothetical protein
MEQSEFITDLKLVFNHEILEIHKNCEEEDEDDLTTDGYG